MAKLIITDGIGLIKLSPVQRYLLGRRYVAFELERMLKVSVQNTPKKRILAKRSNMAGCHSPALGNIKMGLKRAYL